MRNFPRIVFTTLLVLGVWSVGWAIPPIINYQGILLDDSGDPVTTTVSVLFAIWNDPVAGDSLWSETQPITPDADGLFSTLLGSINPIPDSALFGDAYISTKIGADPEMSPRTQLVSVAYAFRPGTVDGATGGVISGDVAIQSDLDVDGELRVTGNAGIGTDVPSEKLQVIGVIHSTTGGFRFPDGSIQTVAAGGGGSAGWVDDGAVVRLDDSTDYVGVGTAGPQGPLHVDGGAAGSGSGDDIIVKGQDGSSDLFANGGSIRLIPGAQGPAGSPGKVFVEGVLQADSNKILGGSGLVLHPSRSYASYGVRIQDAGADCFLEIPNAASWIVRDINFGQNRVAFTGAGDVGIGTMSPTEKLQVAGTVHSTTGGFKFPDNSVQTTAATGGGWIDDGAVVRLDDSTDYVGVGTSVPKGPLHVDGGVAGSGSGADIIVKGQDGSSDLFADGGNIRLIPGAQGPSGSPGKVFVEGVLQADSNKILGGSGLALHPSRSYASYGVRIQDAGANCFLEIPNAASWIVRDINFGQNRVAFTGAGDVGIGTMSPTERLHVVGNICATGTIGACSDARFKKDVSQLSGALELLENVRGVEFQWRRDEYPDLQFDSDRHVGFIAQEVREIIPGVVSQGSDGYYAVDYGRLSPVLVEAIKELKAENALKAEEIRRLQDNLARLEGQVQALLSDRE